MKALIQIVLGVVLGVGLYFGGYVVGRKTVPHVLVYNSAKDSWAPIQLKTDTKLAVASPLGLEPGVAYKIDKMDQEGMVAIILPPSLIPDETPEQPSKPAPQNQSDPGSRIDHMTLLSARQ